MSKISQLLLRSFRCVESLEYQPGPHLNFLIGENAQGKTSILEAVCVLLRLKSPRTANLAEMVRFGGSGFGLEGLLEDERNGFLKKSQPSLRGNVTGSNGTMGIMESDGTPNRFRLALSCTPPDRVLRIDGVPQSSSSEYLSKARIVWFGIDDLSLVNGSAELRRKLLDSIGLQIEGNYGRDLKTYDRALRSRNLLLREGRPRNEIEAYDRPLTQAGEGLMAARRKIVSDLAPLAQDSCISISGEALGVNYLPGADAPLLEALERSRSEEIRLRQTRVGPQRDDVGIELNGIPSAPFASEGQRRTVALSLKLAVSSLLTRENGVPPLLLLDDIFGELDQGRRDALLKGMPHGSQAFLSTTDLSGIIPPGDCVIHRMERGTPTRIS